MQELPEYAIDTIEKVDFVNNLSRSCEITIPEEEAVLYIHPESFDYSEVYGLCEIVQIKVDGERSPVVIAKFEHQKNLRSFEQETTNNMYNHTSHTSIGST